MSLIYGSYTTDQLLKDTTINLTASEELTQLQIKQAKLQIELLKLQIEYYNRTATAIFTDSTLESLPLILSSFLGFTLFPFAVGYILLRRQWNHETKTASTNKIDPDNDPKTQDNHSLSFQNDNTSISEFIPKYFRAESPQYAKTYAQR